MLTDSGHSPRRFDRLAAGTLDGVALHELPFIKVHHGVHVAATRSTHDRGTRHADAENVFRWERTAEGWRDSAEKVDVLTRSALGHHYLDTDDDLVVVEVLRGEYGDGWWQTHG